MPHRALSVSYLTPGVFDMGGIARYGRYQVDALRSLLGRRRVDVVSMLGPDGTGFEEPFDVRFAAHGNGARHKLAFTLASLAGIRPRRVFWAGHLNYAPMVSAYARAAGGASVVNIYGLEVWSNPSRWSRAALSRSWVVSDCHATLDWAVDNGMVDRERATVIWDPVDLARFAPGPRSAALAARYGLALDGRFRVLFMARLARGAAYKQPDALLMAFARARLPADAEIVIGGSGERVPELRELAASLGIGERTIFTGRVPDADLPDLYRLASVLALVSCRGPHGGEGIPLTPLEAAACGVPIIVGDEDGSREAVVEGENGYVVPSRDGAALARALERLAGDRALAARLGEGAARRARAVFSYERFVREHDGFLQRLAASPPIGNP